MDAAELKVGMTVCTCLTHHHEIAEIRPIEDLVVMTDGTRFSIEQCLQREAKADNSCHFRVVWLTEDAPSARGENNT